MDSNSDLPEPWRQFEYLVCRILEEYGFAMQRHTPRGAQGFDFDAVLDNENWAIEVKYYRSSRAQPHLIEAAAARVANRADGIPSRGMLVVSCLLQQPMLLALEKKFGITLIDRTSLEAMVAEKPMLNEELQALIGSSVSQLFENDGKKPDDSIRRKNYSRAAPTPPEDTRGTELCASMRTIPLGKSGWQAYERICADILKYLFPNDLYGWYKQKRTDDGLNRYDLICRIRPTTETDFWKFLIEHLNSRYVVFEFKNYRGKISQGQILTTEKYLLERGLRRVAIIFSRKGAAKDAVKMTQGAMREQGKLMIVVDDRLLCEMLHMRENGKDPSDLLFELTDNFFCESAAIIPRLDASCRISYYR